MWPLPVCTPCPHEPEVMQGCQSGQGHGVPWPAAACVVVSGWSLNLIWTLGSQVEELGDRGSQQLQYGVQGQEEAGLGNGQCCPPTAAVPCGKCQQGPQHKRFLGIIQKGDSSVVKKISLCFLSATKEIL